MQTVIQPHECDPADRQTIPCRKNLQRKRKANELTTFEEILADDIRKAAARADEEGLAIGNRVITLGNYSKSRAIQPNFLGPILKDRFLGGRNS